jgi:nucleoside-diphosphate-sugar epimerase
LETLKVQNRETRLKGAKILVTGAGGFIGSRLVKSLLDSEAEVIALVDERSAPVRLANLAGDPSIKIYHCSLINNPGLAAERERWGTIDLLAHLGLYITPEDHFFGQAIRDIDMNLISSLNLLSLL